jgi:hypothetical protein
MRKAIKWLSSAIIEKIVSHFALPVTLFMLFMCSLCLGGVPWFMLAPPLLCAYIAPKMKGLQIERGSAVALGFMWLMGCMCFVTFWVLGVGFTAAVALLAEASVLEVMEDALNLHRSDLFESVGMALIVGTKLTFIGIGLLGLMIWPLASVSWIARLLEDVEVRSRTATWSLGAMMMFVEGPLFLFSLLALKVLAACSC